ncbi:MAG: dihydropteroate synthase [Candidatus Symbiothrix sp.]|nr:dihydropteroate synthase [Candidatus Symbiothrix sp.]
MPSVSIQLSEFPVVMGILNLTPDSFYADSRKQTEKAIAERVCQILTEGAAIIDVGAYSSRPQAAFVDEAEESARLQFGLETLFREAPDALVSIDTFRSQVARQAIERFGKRMIINDISAGQLDKKMFDTVAELQVPYLIMHMRGTPQTMMQDTHYTDLMPEILQYFSEKIDALRQKGVQEIWLDPGFGFSKTLTQNYKVLQNLPKFAQFKLPLLVGFSRKTMIREVLGVSTAEALNGTTVLNTVALMQGADILRVHDVKEAVEAVKLFKAITV